MVDLEQKCNDLKKENLTLKDKVNNQSHVEDLQHEIQRMKLQSDSSTRDKSGLLQENEQLKEEMGFVSILSLHTVP